MTRRIRSPTAEAQLGRRRALALSRDGRRDGPRGLFDGDQHRTDGIECQRYVQTEVRAHLSVDLPGHGVEYAPAIAVHNLHPQFPAEGCRSKAPNPH